MAIKICVVGSGYVGLVTGACLADSGTQVVCVDKDVAKIDHLKSGEIPIYEPGLKEIVDKNVSEGRLSFSTNLDTTIREAQVVFIAVGTPPAEDGSADLTFVRQVASSIAKNLNDYKVIVTKSTVPVGTGQMIEEILERESAGGDFAVVSNPEFLREGSAIDDFLHPDRVVIGSRDPRATEIMLDIYSPLRVADVEFVTTNVESAELIKYASNAFLATKISFINEVAHLCEKLGADVQVVARGMGLDSRIGNKFLHPGPGFGGSCFPKDTQSVAHIAQTVGLRFKIVEAVLDVNEATKLRMVDKITEAIGDPAGKTIGVLGLAFKPDTDDMRESPSLPILHALHKLGANIQAYDPAAMDAAASMLPSEIQYCGDSYAAATGTDALVILTEWNQFRKLELERLKEIMNEPIIVDLRNVYHPTEMQNAGFGYHSIGRPESAFREAKAKNTNVLSSKATTQ